MAMCSGTPRPPRFLPYEGQGADKAEAGDLVWPLLESGMRVRGRGRSYRDEAAGPAEFLNNILNSLKQLLK